ncbi:hypothetical protein WN944_027638 [Citrus x changshan-huyou]|uniref:Uncharacterized protein n=1 Tax=Citrus x changshan-huyou TaxID=2935761 RepID=A0AAP0LIB1_9ROSI
MYSFTFYIISRDFEAQTIESKRVDVQEQQEMSFLSFDCSAECVRFWSVIVLSEPSFSFFYYKLTINSNGPRMHVTIDYLFLIEAISNVTPKLTPNQLLHHFWCNMFLQCNTKMVLSIVLHQSDI